MSCFALRITFVHTKIYRTLHTQTKIVNVFLLRAILLCSITHTCFCINVEVVEIQQYQVQIPITTVFHFSEEFSCCESLLR